MLPGLPPTRRRLRAVRHQLRRRRRLIAAALAAAAVLGALRTLAPPPAETVDVLVAARDLASGTRLADGDLVARPYPVDLAPSGAATTAVGRVLAAPMARGEVLTDVRVVGPGLALAQPGETILPVRLPDPGMAALLRPGDLVARPYPVDLAPSGAATTAVGRVLAAPMARGEVLTDVRVVGPGLALAQPGETIVPVRLPDPGMAALLRPGDEIDLVATDPGTGASDIVARDVIVLATPTGVPDGPAGGSGGALVVLGATSDEAIAVASASLSQFLTVSWSR